MGSFEQVRCKALQSRQPTDVDKQKLLLKGEVFLQIAVTAEGIDRVGHQRFVFSETGWGEQAAV